MLSLAPAAPETDETQHGSASAMHGASKEPLELLKMVTESVVSSRSTSDVASSLASDEFRFPRAAEAFFFDELAFLVGSGCFDDNTITWIGNNDFILYYFHLRVELM
jgi:hypothetical protein